jgi:NHS family xanthosine MFS transporter
MITNGLGAMLGGWGAGMVVDHFTVVHAGQSSGDKNWQAIWFTFAIYSLVLAIIFAIVFKYKHNPKEI